MKKICGHCNTEFECKSKKAMFCSNICKAVAYSEEKFPDGSNYVQCRICGLRGRQLIQHIRKMHGMTVEEYCEKFGL